MKKNQQTASSVNKSLPEFKFRIPSLPFGAIRNQRGINPLLVVFFVALAILVMASLNDMGSYDKGKRSANYTSFYSDIQTINSTIMSTRDKNRILYGGSISSETPKINQKFYGMPANITQDSLENIVNGEYNSVTSPGRTLSGQTPTAKGTAYRSVKTTVAGMLSVEEMGAYKTTTVTGPAAPHYRITDSFNVLLTPTTALSNAQPNGAFFSRGILKSDVPDLDKHMFLGLLNGSETFYGRELESKGKVSYTGSPVTTNTAYADLDPYNILEILTVAFGDSTTRFSAAQTPDSWFQLVPVNTQVLLNTSELSGNVFANEEDYRMFYVTKVAHRDNAKKVLANYMGIAVPTAANPEFDRMMEVYDSAVKTVLPNTVVAIPLNEDAINYTESSDYKYYAFGSND